VVVAVDTVEAKDAGIVDAAAAAAADGKSDEDTRDGKGV